MLRAVVATIARVDGTQRKFLACLAALVSVAAVLDGASGVVQLAMNLLPLLLVAGLLLCGRFVAEDRIVRRWRRAVPASRLRRARSCWPAVALLAPVSRLTRVARVERGPPALAAA